MFQGNTDIEQLALVIKILGTPNARDWPEMDSLPDFNKIQCVFTLYIAKIQFSSHFIMMYTLYNQSLEYV